MGLQSGLAVAGFALGGDFAYIVDKLKDWFMWLRTSLFVGIIVGLGFGNVWADDDRLTDAEVAANVMWFSFECSMFAELIGEQEKQSALVDEGIKAGKYLYDKAQSDPDARFEHMPSGVGWYFGGRSGEFATGRVYERASQNAYEHSYERTPSGDVLIGWEERNDKREAMAMAMLSYKEYGCDELLAKKNELCFPPDRGLPEGIKSKVRCGSVRF